VLGFSLAAIVVVFNLDGLLRLKTCI